MLTDVRPNAFAMVVSRGIIASYLHPDPCGVQLALKSETSNSCAMMRLARGEAAAVARRETKTAEACILSVDEELKFSKSLEKMEGDCGFVSGEACDDMKDFNTWAGLPLNINSPRIWR